MTDPQPAYDGDVDRELLLPRLGQDPLAFEAFYRRHLDRITGFAARRCDGPEEVADLVAAVFLAVIEGAHRFDPARGEPVGWLFGIAANQLRAQRRRSWRQRGIVVRVSGQRHLDPDDTLRFEERIDAERLGDDLRRAISLLPRGERAVFELVSRDGLTPSQTAVALGISPGAVRARLSRARTKLRQHLSSALDPDTPARTPRPQKSDRSQRTRPNTRPTAEEVAP